MDLSLAPLAVLAQAAPREYTAIQWMVGLTVLAAYALYVVFVARWLHRDTKRRGHNTPLWLTIFLIGSIPGVGTIFGLATVVVYLFVRSPRIKYDDHGHLYVPPRPPPGQPVVPAPPAAWPPSQGPPSAAAPTTQLPVGRPLPPGLPTPLPSTPMQRVKCPYCLTIFPYQRAFEGLTHVKCPACGQEGNI